jgi:hypothetical protein
MQVNNLLQVRHDTLMLESGSETSGKVIERNGKIKMTRRMELNGLMDVNGLI